MAPRNILGADIGSVSVALAEVNPAGEILRKAYRFHHGRVDDVLEEMLGSWDLSAISATAATTGSSDTFVADHLVDWTTAHVLTHRMLHPATENLLIVGGERFGMIQFDANQNYRSYRGNSTCAAGTGSFLDQQASRLGLNSAAELADRALTNPGERPMIASRCSVFAKTDLIHAQQEGHGTSEICDGLCHGMSRNLVDALVAGRPPQGSFVMCGGVALNPAVVRYVGELLGRSVQVTDQAVFYGAIGAALSAIKDRRDTPGSAQSHTPVTLQQIIRRTPGEGGHFYDPISFPDNYPDFDKHHQLIHESPLHPGFPVEVDRYSRPVGKEALFLGVDIGSTSTKAVLMSRKGVIRQAFYTRTAGAPLNAIKAIFGSIDELDYLRGQIIGVATTGSGRKLIGKIIGADLVLDEISAHARAAVELDPETDTIIEIGGQDAKFTTLSGGQVTFSQMNAVCAAGTGSFLEEQAAKLGVPLSAYAQQSIGVAAPLTSDRCTVFMERDLNHMMNTGYRTQELLAAALHSVRENYLQKVARLSAIGSHVCFQGATAKNPGLVGAFQQRLGRPVTVSQYCHVTGAYGAALTCRDEITAPTTFRGISLHTMEIPVRQERCELCTNHCRLTIATVGESEMAYGFLCGRDYDTEKFVTSNQSGHDLMASRRKVLREVSREFQSVPTGSVESLLSYLGLKNRPGPDQDTQLLTIGIPTGLQLAEEHPFWIRVFETLGFKTVIPRDQDETLSVGKTMEGAEFCTPVAVFHGQIGRLVEAADLVFVPLALDAPGRAGEVKTLCYYTQFTPSMLKGVLPEGHAGKLVMPVLNSRDPAQELSDALSPWRRISPSQIRNAMSQARLEQHQVSLRLREVFAREFDQEHINVMLLGRPYTVVDPAMNKGIPDILGRHGVKAFYQDMLPAELASDATTELVDGVHWRFAADILMAADQVARTPGLYPLLVTSFKCAPDAFSLDAFTRIMEEAQKPYLVLQLDEHDSNVGYETRVEAALRSFRNHHAQASFRPLRPDRRSSSPVLELEDAIGDKTLLMPCWDPITTPLLAATLRGHGINAVALTETELSIQKSMRLNSGQCLPVSAIAQEAIDYVRDNDLDPAKTVLWMGRGKWSCGLPLYPRFLKNLFVREGLPELGVYVGLFTYADISAAATVGAYFAYQFGGWIRSIACKIRPYEAVPGRTDALVESWQRRLELTFERRDNRLRPLQQMVREFRAIPTIPHRRPKVAIFGDLYVRDNEVMNQDLIHRIEAAGGEAVTLPYSDYIKIISSAAFGRMRRQKDVVLMAKLRVILSAIEGVERIYHREVEEFVGPPVSARQPHLEEDLKRFGMVVEQHGESYENALKILHLASRHDDLALLVQTSPAFCCPSLVTEALGEAIEQIVGIPMVTITYDGTAADKNNVIVPYIRYPRFAKTT